MDELNILSMNAEMLRALDPEMFERDLLPEEILHIVEATDNYLKLPPAPLLGTRGPVPNYHIKLKSGKCSNGFINFKELLKNFPNLRAVLARQISRKLREMFRKGYQRPDWIAGIPEAATELGREVAKMVGTEFLELKKVDKRIVLDDEKLLMPGETILLVEDLCTLGTGVTETILLVLSKRDDVEIVPYIMYIANRGPLESVVVEGKVSCEIIPLVRERIEEFEPTPDACPYCANGSEPIKAKEGDNWSILNRKEMDMSR